MNEPTNTSAYASAESSPNSSLTPSSNSFQVNLENLNQIDSSEIIMAQLTNNNNSKSTNNSLPNSYSTHSLVNSGLSTNMNEFQSLPPAQSTQSLNQNSSNSSTVKSIIGSVVKSSLTDLSPKKQQQQQQIPQSPSRSSAVMSFFGKMLNKKSSSNNNHSTVENNKTITATTLSSTSSPNPECSPYKFLQTEVQIENNTNSQHPTPLSPNRLSTANKLGTLSPNGTTINDAVAIFNAATQIEKLASLSHKEHEQADPILTTSSSSSSDNLSSENNHPSVPLSSEQFCNDLNVKLASQVAANSPAPIVVQTFSNSNNNNNTKTSNDTTSSIHNDLKMILEESKEKNKVKKLLISENSNESPSTNLKKLLAKTKSREHLIQLLNEMSYVNNQNKLSYTKEFLEKVRMERLFLIEKELIPEKFKQYDVCMLNNNNTQKNKTGCCWDPEKYFDMIQYPNKSINHSSSINNNKQQNRQKHNKMQRITNNQQNNDEMFFESPQPLQVPKNSPKSVQSLKGQQNQNFLQQNGTSKKQTSTNSHINNENAGHKLLDMLKNKTSKNNNNNNILDMLHQKKTITTPKNGKHQQTKSSSTNQHDILNEILNIKKPIQQQQQPTQPRHFPQVLTVQELEMSQISQQQNSILPSSNLNNNNTNNKTNKRSKNNRYSVGGGSSQNTSSCSSTSSTISSCNSNEYNLMSFINNNQNSSDAYKQLVKNLSNHPLSTPPTNSNNQLNSQSNQQRLLLNSINQDILLKFQSNAQNKIPLVLNQNQQLEQQRVSETKMLKQLLNLNKSKESSSSNKQHKKKNHQNNKNNEFPTVNPHERPFQSILPDSCIQMPTNPIENILFKINQQHHQQQQENNDNNNFNQLLNKLTINNNNINEQTMTQQHHLETVLLNNQQQPQKSDDILKWFNGAMNNQNSIMKPAHFDILRNLY